MDTEDTVRPGLCSREVYKPSVQLEDNVISIHIPTVKIKHILKILSYIFSNFFLKMNKMLQMQLEVQTCISSFIDLFRTSEDDIRYSFVCVTGY